ncbi:acyl-CoA desaturase [Nocardioides aestuarii]|uniref:Fatty acid desaturase family protein n=1 Tax=Nocardioides aestuarii TaxID=252231 RepID=A0ABW4TMT6_9ACTN
MGDGPTPAVRDGSYRELARQVREAGHLDRRLGFYWGTFATLLAALAGLVAAMVHVGDSWWQLVLAGGLGLVLTQFGFLGHDAAHHQVFASPRANDRAARVLAGAFTGLSHAWWTGKHDRHHVSPNREGHDPDIGPGVIAFTPAAAEGRSSGAPGWFQRHQGWLFFPLLTLEGAHLHLASLRALTRRGTLRRNGVDLAVVAVRLGGYVAALLLLLPPLKALCFVAVQLAVLGVCLGGSFAPNHKGMPILPRSTTIEFLPRQVLMSRNVRGGRVVDLAMGGLNYQIEHHLFPRMPRPNLRRAQPLVREHCRAHGIPYTELGLLASYAVVVDYLNHVGLRARGPFECPLAADLRSPVTASKR